MWLSEAKVDVGFAKSHPILVEQLDEFAALSDSQTANVSSTGRTQVLYKDHVVQKSDDCMIKRYSLVQDNYSIGARRRATNDIVQRLVQRYVLDGVSAACRALETRFWWGSGGPERLEPDGR